LGLLARREHSRSELAAKLAARGVGSEIAEHVLAELSAGALQSDERFAEDYARARIERGYGPEQILAGLRERGIDETILLHHVDPRDPAWIERLAETRRGTSATYCPWTRNSGHASAGSWYDAAFPLPSSAGS